jgi:carbon storage regulator
MLALSRRAGQSLAIGTDVTVTVVRLEGDRVVLAIAAPREVRIVRGELLAAVSDETRGAATSAERVRSLLGAIEPRP